MNSFDVIKTVRLTEKGTRQGEKYNQYTVKADRLASKPQIKLASARPLRFGGLSAPGSGCNSRSGWDSPRSSPSPG